MNSKGRRFLLYFLIGIMAVSQVAFAGTERDNTSEESVESNQNTVLSEESQTEAVSDSIILETTKDKLSTSSELTTMSYVTYIGNEETTDNSGISEENENLTSADKSNLSMEEEYLGVNPAQTDSNYKDMIVSYADPYLPVRTEADRESSTVGKMYPGSYANVIERGEEWTKIESGNVTGYIQNIYVCFDEEAEDLAGQLQGTLATAITLAEEKKQQEEAAAAKAAAAAAATTGGSTATSSAVSASSYEVCLLAAIIDWEANSEPYDGKLAVAYVVLNRVNSASYGNSIEAVIGARGQFGGVTDGSGNWSSRFQERINKYTNGASTDCVKAANDALAGNGNPLNANYLYFNTRISSASQWQQIGNHYFYNY